jgi:hypothetical protein
MISFALVLILNNSSGSIFFNKFSIIPIRWLPEVVFSRLESSSKVIKHAYHQISLHCTGTLYNYYSFIDVTSEETWFCCNNSISILRHPLVLGISTHSITYTTLPRRVYLVWMNLSEQRKIANDHNWMWCAYASSKLWLIAWLMQFILVLPVQKKSGIVFIHHSIWAFDFL